ncbi:MAG: PAS domain-containing protein, partial [Proteobacteria bacterium]|nr:PAS domain-containing protein [Pseudomonadota bacterium]
QRLGRILDSSFNEIYVFDAETYRFTQINQGAFSNLGYTMDELHHLTPWDLKPEFDAESFAAAVAPLRSGEKELLVFETEHRRKDASLYPVEVRLQLSWTETPPVLGMLSRAVTVYL